MTYWVISINWAGDPIVKVIASFKNEYEADMAAKAAREKLPEDIDHITYSVVQVTNVIRNAYQRSLASGGKRTGNP